MRPTPHPRQNLLLAALPPEILERWLPQLQRFDLGLGDVLYEPGITMSHVHFPTNAIVSLLYVMENGASAEIAVVGKEGVVGIALFMGGNSTPSRAVVQSAGGGYRMPADAIYREFSSTPAVMHLMLRYTQALITQVAQTAVCNRHHTIDQQLCRWLLLSMDRLSHNELTMTQEFISNMLGVARPGVSLAASKLERMGVISYQRGLIKVLDRPKLESLSCECYRVVKRETDVLLHYLPQRQVIVHAADIPTVVLPQG
jgi:CRP-like cAMP-binding protein